MGHLRILLPLGLAWWAPSLAPGVALEPAQVREVDEPLEPQDPTIQAPRLLHTVALSYPSEALESGLHGDVSLLVRVGTDGAVLWVSFESGPQVFEAAALDAAQRLEFAPALRAGVPFEATTRIWFHFAPPELAPSPETSAVVLVHAEDPDRESIQAQTTLDQQTLDSRSGEGLADTIEQVPGVYTAPTTSDTAKPIIRGHQERRLLVLYDGVRHESQSWGPDHATEIDPFSAGSIRVIRGPAGTRYGADAIGGVVLVEPPVLSTQVGLHGKALAAFETNGARPYAALRLDGVSAAHPDWSFRVEGNGSYGSSLKAPDYVLGNTASRSWNLGGAVGRRTERGGVVASWHHNALKAGAFYGVSTATPAEFLQQYENGRPVNAESWTADPEIDRPYQQVSHDVGIVKADRSGPWGSVVGRYAFQRNHRQEFSTVRTTVTGPQYDFILRTHSLDLLYMPAARPLGEHELQSTLGLQGSFQENVYRGYSLLPNYRAFAGGLFTTQRVTLRRVDLEAGARMDGLFRATYLSEADYGKHERRDTLSTKVCELYSSGARCPASYHAASASLGAQLHVVPQLLDLKGELSSTGRFPDADELFLIGAAPSFPVFALGAPDLETERAWTATLTSTLLLSWLRLEVSGYAQRIQDYIYFAPDLNADGAPRYEVTIQGTWPRYAYQAVDANFRGLDGAFTLLPDRALSLEATGALVRTADASTGAGLIGTPPDNLRLTLVGRPPPVGPFKAPELELGTLLVAEQTRVDPSADFAPPPESYALLNAGLSAEVGPTRVSVQGRNLLDTAYRDYTSLLRYYADQPGRSVHVRVGVDF
ncbi:MAG: TonB-dependent receptor [Myxococcota bacterium]|nr:TonB-dependent receptor [Myxococcota bacterium]